MRNFEIYDLAALVEAFNNLEVGRCKRDTGQECPVNWQFRKTAPHGVWQAIPTAHTVVSI